MTATLAQVEEILDRENPRSGLLIIDEDGKRLAARDRAPGGGAFVIVVGAEAQFPRAHAAPRPRAEANPPREPTGPRDTRPVPPPMPPRVPRRVLQHWEREARRPPRTP